MNWFKKYCSMTQAPYGRVQARDYMQLMQELNQGASMGLPGHRNIKLLNKMVNDLESAVMNVYWNTVAMGHTANEYGWPCPDCNGVRRTIEEILDGEIILMKLYGSVEEYVNGEDYYGEDPENVPQSILDAFENKDSSEGIFICDLCSKAMTFYEVQNEMSNPFSGGRDVLISDQIEHLVDYLAKIKAADSFEGKFPYFEGIIEWVHGSGDMSEWFIEGGSATIDKYRSSRLPSRYTEDQFEEWVHPRRREKENYDWSNV